MDTDRNKTPYQGQCLCGTIKYEIDEIESQMAHCHCSMCRKFHGAAFSTYGEAKTECFRWLEGLDSLKTYLADNGTKRKFCERCGSSLIFVPSADGGKFVEFSLGTLDSEIDIKPDAHVFSCSAASWYEINDSLPKFTEGRDSKYIK